MDGHGIGRGDPLPAVLVLWFAEKALPLAQTTLLLTRLGGGAAEALRHVSLEKGAEAR